MKTVSIFASLSRQAGGLFYSGVRLHQCLSQVPGIAVSVFGLQDEFTAADLPAWAPVQTRHFPILGPKSFGYSPALRRELSNDRFDLLHTHGLWMYPSVAASGWHRQRTAPYVVSPHGMLDGWAVKNSRWKKRVAAVLYENRHLQQAACLRALCEGEARAIRDYGLKNPIAVIPNGVDLPQAVEHTVPVPQPASSPLSGLKANGRKVLLYLGRVHPKKGLVALIKAWARFQKARTSTLNTQPDQWVLVIAGWDQNGHESELKSLASDCGVEWAERRVQSSEFRVESSDFGGQRSGVSAHSAAVSGQTSLVFIGPQFGEAKCACYRECDAFILPSFSEGLPMVVLEAWAHAKPVLMTPQCNVGEGFDAGAAIRIDPQPESITRGIRELASCSNPELAAMGQRGLDLVSRRFAWPKIVMDMKTLYEWLLGGGPNPPFVFT